MEPMEPYLEITEQPGKVKFRYTQENRATGEVILGINSNDENTIYPTVKIHGYRGKAVILVACVSEDYPYSNHPNKLVGNSCSNGIFKAYFDNSMTLSLKKVGIQRVTRREANTALELRSVNWNDPLRQGFSSNKSFNFQAVKLCFEAVLIIENHHKCLAPIISETIYDKRNLNIIKLMPTSAPFRRRTEVIILCSKIKRGDIKIIFFKEENGKRYWQYVIDPCYIHSQVAICFKTPALSENDFPGDVYIQLFRCSDKMFSDAKPFKFIPDRCFSNLGDNPKRSRLTKDIFIDLPQINNSNNITHYTHHPLPNPSVNDQPSTSMATQYNPNIIQHSKVNTFDYTQGEHEKSKENNTTNDDYTNHPLPNPSVNDQPSTSMATQYNPNIIQHSKVNTFDYTQGEHEKSKENNTTQYTHHPLPNPSVNDQPSTSMATQFNPNYMQLSELNFFYELREEYDQSQESSSQILESILQLETNNQSNNMDHGNVKNG